jgi:RNA polymerase sigma-70 factor (ECF subfamily)
MSLPAANAFTELYADMASALRAWAVLQTRGVLGRYVEADDLVQEVCFQAYRSFARFDAGRGSFRRWVFGVASHVASDLLRQAARTRARGLDADVLGSQAGGVPEDATTLSRRVARDEGLLLFLARVDELDEPDRQLLLWRGLEGLAHDDVARLIGVNEETVKKRWQRLRARLQQLPAAADLLESE